MDKNDDFADVLRDLHLAAKETSMRSAVDDGDQGIEINPRGGKQSKVATRCDLFPPRSFLHVAAILKEGAAKYGDNNWHKITTLEHINHALRHWFLYQTGDRSEDHLGHFTCRGLMAMEIHLMEEEKKDAAPQT